VTTAVREAPHHRNLTCYTDFNCRRDVCVQRYNDWDRDRRARQAQGTWDNLVDAAPVRDHILQLEKAGVLPNRIAKAAGVPLQSVRDFTNPRARSRRYRTAPDTATRILAVTTDAATPLYVDPTATHRRIQALLAAGWPLIYIDRRLGYKRERMRKILTEKVILGSTEQLIAATYDELGALKPERHGVPKKYARQARRRAAAERWPTPAYWAQYPDAIDDLHFTPEYKKLRAEIVAEEAAWLMTAGRLDREQAAARLGVSLFTVDRALREHPQDGLQQAA
jgi:hypothetical protein